MKGAATMHSLPQQATEAAITKAATAAQAAGSTVAAASGTGLVLGLTTTQWSVVGILGGLIVALAGVIAKTWVDIYFRAQHLKLSRQVMHAGDEDEE
jgi:F0F1-type ATP synthase assembly protein I